MKQIITLTGILEEPFNAKAISGGEHLFASSKLRFNTLSKTDDSNSHNSWITLEAWNDRAEAVLHLKKGSKVKVSGELFQRRWTDDHGNKNSMFKIAVESIELEEAVKEQPVLQKKPSKAKYSKYLPSNQKGASAQGEF